MKKKIFFSKSIVHHSTIIIYALFAHSIILLVDGIYWDDWILYFNLIGKHWETLKQFDSELGGIPVGYYLLYIMGNLPYPLFLFRLLTLCSIVLSGFLVYNICLKINNMTHRDCLLITLFFIGYPAFQLSFMLSACTYWFWYFIFLLACYTSILSTKNNYFDKLIFRSISFLLFSISFRVNSLLAFYFGFLVILFSFENGKLMQFNFEKFIKNIVIKSYYIIFPFFYYLIIKKYFPSSGIYKTYNQIKVYNFSKVIMSALYFVKNAIIDQFVRSISFSSKYFYVWMTIAISMFLIYKFIYLRKDYICKNKIDIVPSLSFGLYLLLLGILPYATVHKYPHDYGVETRHSILVGLPIAIISISIFKLKSENLRGFKDFLILIIIASFTLSIINNYFAWQAHWIIDKSMMHHLRTLDPQNYSIFWVDDEVIIKDTEPWHQYYAYSAMFKSVWGGNSRIGLDIRDKKFYSSWIKGEGKKYFKIKRYNLYELNIKGAQALIKIQAGLYPKQIGLYRLTLLYWYYKYFARDMLSNFLLKITHVTLHAV